MFDSPVVLVFLGMSALSGAVALARKLRRPSTALAALSDQELHAILTSLRHSSADIETRRRIMLLVLEELERRRA